MRGDEFTFNSNYMKKRNYSTKQPNRNKVALFSFVLGLLLIGKNVSLSRCPWVFLYVI